MTFLWVIYSLTQLNQLKMKNVIVILASFLFVLGSNYTRAQGCMDAASDEGVNIVGYIQPQAEYSFLGDNLRGESLNESDFYFNRVRLGVVGNIPYDFSYYAMAELSPTLGGPYILDAYVSYTRFAPYAKISFGQFKSPFGLELSTACHKLYTINRSEVVSNLSGPFRDFGLMVSGTTGEWNGLGTGTKDLIGYQFALMNGTGLNNADDNHKKDFIGRITFHPFEFITVGASYRTGKHPALSEGVDDDQRNRFGIDLDLNYKNFRIQGEFVDGSDDGSYTVGGGCGDPLEVIQGSVDRRGFFTQAMYRSKWNVEPVIKFERYDPSTAEADIDDIHNVITYGVNYYFNEWTRLQINYLYRAEESARVEIPNDVLLVQMQIAF